MKEHLTSLRGHIFGIWDSFIKWSRQYWTLFLIYLGIGSVVFFMLMSQNLVNPYDGVWFNSSYYAGRWEWSIGRWFLPFLDKLRFGIVSTSLNSFVALILISCGNVLLIDLFQIKHKLPAVLSGALFIATPLICDSLSYCFMSVSFGLAYLLSVISAYCALKIPKKSVAIIVGGWFTAWSMGTYQAYLGVTCIILLIYFIKKLFEDSDLKTIRDLIIISLGTVIIGGLMYEGMVTIINTINHVELASYRGADSVSIRSIIVNLPQRILVAYKDFIKFYFTDRIQKPYFHLRWVYLIAFAITACILAFKLIDISRHNFLNGFLSILALIIIPIACNAAIVITTTSTSLVMTGGTVILFPLFICLFDGFMDRKLLYSAYLCILTVMLWVNISIVNNDQLAMREGQNTTVTIAQNIVTRLADEGYIDSDSNNIFAFMGKPSNSSMFSRTEAFNKANDYAQFGDGYNDNPSIRRIWYGVLYGYCGITLNFCSDDQYEEFKTNEEVKDMPCFPDEGSIKEINGITVVKVSNTY